ncbi:MAG: DUF4350 domain-containing protein, partial [Pyrinomonadaceae bacterium]
MKQKHSIFILLALMIALLAFLNAASYVQKEKTPDREWAPNRSTFNAGATGTQAFYTLLNESGRKVVQWQEPPAALLTAKSKTPNVFVVIGAIPGEFTNAEVDEVLRWVSGGGRLVIIDRQPPNDKLVVSTANWKIAFQNAESPDLYSVDPVDQKQMIADTAAVKAVQPTVLTANINAIQPSKFATSVSF